LKCFEIFLKLGTVYWSGNLLMTFLGMLPLHILSLMDWHLTVSWIAFDVISVLANAGCFLFRCLPAVTSTTAHWLHHKAPSRTKVNGVKFRSLA